MPQKIFAARNRRRPNAWSPAESAFRTPRSPTKRAARNGRAKPSTASWFDEEPPLDIYSEGKTRTNARNGIVIITFTPLLGMSDVVRFFLTQADVAKMHKLAKEAQPDPPPDRVE